MRHLLHLFNYCPRCGSDKFAENDFKSKRCGDCGFTYYFNPLAATVGIITNSKGEVLVARRAKEPAKGTLDLPGGFCDSYETAEEGVRREIEEETGLRVCGTRYLFSIPNTYMYSGMELHTMDMFFHCKVKDTERLIADDDVADLRWVEIEQLDAAEFGLQSIRNSIQRFKEMYKKKIL
jgi:mutator protein MutT